MALFLTLFIILLIIITSYIYVKRVYSYWEIKGIPYIKPSIPFGNTTGLKPQKQFGILLKDFYDQLKGKGPMAGLYFMWRPVVMPMDVKLIRRILITDFTYFEERPVFRNENVDKLTRNLFFLDSEKWRALRRKLSPTFTSGKMKFMFPTMVDVAENLKIHMDKLIGVENDFFVQKTIVKYSTDVIGTCAFGIECNSLADKNEDFRRMGLKSFEKRSVPAEILVILDRYSRILRLLKVRIFPKDVEEFFTKVAKDTVEHREQNNINRNDFMDILINLKNNSDDPITMQELIAQAFIFFVAGFETSSTTMMYFLYELSKNLDIQEKCRAEIDSVFAKHNGQFTYEALMDLKYMDNVITETLRLHPPLGHIFRKAIKDYHIPELNITLPKKTEIVIPSYGLQIDPDIYPEPEKFIPDRFLTTDENRIWLPFGEGPRNCIGIRFAQMQMKTGLVTLLKNYRFSFCEKTQHNWEFDIRNIIMIPKDGIWLKATKISS